MIIFFTMGIDPFFHNLRLVLTTGTAWRQCCLPLCKLIFFLLGYQLFKNVLDDSLLVDQVSELLNKDPPSPNWRDLAAELEIPVKKLKIFEFSEDDSSPTKLLLKRTAKYEPDMTFEELVLALVAMKRQDVLDILYKYFLSKFIF